MASMGVQNQRSPYFASIVILLYQFPSGLWKMHFPLQLTLPLMAQFGDGGEAPNAEVSNGAADRA